jgi:hypothetical protein
MIHSNQKSDRDQCTADTPRPQQQTMHDLCERSVREMTARRITSRAEIYDAAVENFCTAFPQFKPYEYLASAMGMSTSALRQKVADDDRRFTVQEEETFFRLCNFPQGFVMKQALVFQMPFGEGA